MPENEKEQQSEQSPPTASPEEGQRRGRLLRVLLAVGILATGSFTAGWWLTHRPTPKRKESNSKAVLVKVSQVQPGPQQLVVQALGTVIPARSTNLASRVSGEIVRVSPQFVPGGFFPTGRMVAKIDPKDYELALREKEAQVLKADADLQQRLGEEIQRKTDVTQAAAALELEMGQQSVAKGEYELLRKTIAPEDKSLVLREPQLKTARAKCEACQGALKAVQGTIAAARASQTVSNVAVAKANLDLKRTILRAPFNAMIQVKHVDLGAQISSGTAIATVVGTDEYWIRISVPMDELRQIKVPGLNGDEGSNVRVYHESAWGAKTHRTGKVIRLLPDLEPQGRMARLLVVVKDPLELKTASKERQRRPLLLGSYVRVEIDGRTLTGVTRVPRSALHDGGQVWIMKPDGTLDIRGVETVWSANQYVLVSKGLSAGELLVVTKIVTPVHGMFLRTAKASTKPSGKSGGRL